MMPLQDYDGDPVYWNRREQIPVTSMHVQEIYRGIFGVQDGTRQLGLSRKGRVTADCCSCSKSEFLCTASKPASAICFARRRPIS